MTAPAAAPIGVTRAEFARQMGVNRSTVTRWAEQGRLVLLTDGSVDAAASRLRIDQTSGGRDDVAARHAAARARNGAQDAPAGQGGTASITPPVDNAPAGLESSRPPGVETRADAQARKESAAADLLEIELQEKRGSMLPADQAEAAFRAVGAAVRAALDVLPDQTAPLVAPVTDLDECHALLSDACRHALAAVGAALDRARVELLGSGAGTSGRSST